MKKPCILRILKDILLHQQLLAEMLATPQIRDLGRQHYLHEEIKRNHADFDRLVAEFQVQVEPRELIG